ncbi:MAG TPA: aminoacyl-tRNA hydrolase [Acidimicrobiales bacterium]|nr:aminoacyl-tRNA hydrolase [Acidimicrobiales bacterium]
MTTFLVVGLGNPGKDYAHTRHNAGADAVELLAGRHNEKLKRDSKNRSLTATTRMDDARVILAFPQTYMNESGAAVSALASYYGVEDPTRIVIVHDELDIEVGRIKLKQGGGLAGNNGLRSIKAHLHTDAFLRVRIGIGKPPGKSHGANHVLTRPTKAEAQLLAVTIEEAADAVEKIVKDGIEAAMNAYNTRSE